MNKKKNRKRNRNFSPQDASIKRKANTKNERQSTSKKEELPLMLFSFKDFQYNSQTPPGQTYEDWQEKELLAYMLDKFGHICNENRVEAEQKKFIKVYGEFPKNSEFENPFLDLELNWAVIMKIKGQKPRVAGYIDGHIFYVVFLDFDHKFYPSTKKNT